MLVTGGIARAEPPTSNDYAIELYDGVAYGNIATIAMGGAAVANAVGSSGTLVNPAAGAVRPTTDTGSVGWDYHLDAVTSSLSSDADNNGNPYGDRANGGNTLSIGIMGRYHDWALAVTGSYTTTKLDQTITIGSEDSEIEATAARSIIAVSKYFPSIDFAIGVSIDVARLSLDPTCAGAGCDSLFAISAGGLGAGATWLPSLTNLRVGGSIRSTYAGGKVDVSTCDPMNCYGYVLPDTVVSPWRFALGAAYRFAETEWNQLVGGTFRDEESLTLVADLVVTGASPNAFGLEGFGAHDLQRSGAHVAVSPRAGAEYEWLPGRLRVRAGSYWEPARFDAAGGRVHATFGIEGRVFEFQFLGRRRGRITLTGDVAHKYNNVGLSVGFWH